MFDKAKIKNLCDKCLIYGNFFQKSVAQTVRSQNYAASRKQQAILCDGASYKGGSYVSHIQSQDNDWDRDSY